VNDKNEEGRAEALEVRGPGEEAAGRIEEPLCRLQPGPEGFALCLPPTGPFHWAKGKRVQWAAPPLRDN
jgi:hypothetical protein